ncbi:MAG: cytochrome c oxidase assembly protein [Xanthomonadales bacterium]|nr:cytochrome c oxidase assembly protein [Xanthomonadales bacterium]
MNTSPSNKKLFLLLTGLAVGMFGFGFALVPLYSVFCDALGIKLGSGGSGKITQDISTYESDEERWITIQFDSSVDSKLPWEFRPDQDFMKVRVGELTETTFFAANLDDQAVIGHAVPSIAPAEASIYMAKTECFCFNRQQLAGGESQQMPVRFIIDPELPEKIKVLTLSYRFYRSDQTAQLTNGE